MKIAKVTNTIAVARGLAKKSTKGTLAAEREAGTEQRAEVTEMGLSGELTCSAQKEQFHSFVYYKIIYNKRRPVGL